MISVGNSFAIDLLIFLTPHLRSLILRVGPLFAREPPSNA